MSIFTFLDSSAKIVVCIHDLICKAFTHGLFAAFSGIADKPAKSKSGAAFRSNFDRNLICGTTNTASLDFKAGHDVVHSGGECFNGIVAGLVLDDIECIVDDLLSNTLLAVEHNSVDQTSNQHTVVHRIRQDLSLGNITSSGHLASLLHYKMISSVLAKYEDSALRPGSSIIINKENNRALLLVIISYQLSVSWRRIYYGTAYGLQHPEYPENHE